MGFLHSWPLYQWFITPCYSMVVSDYNFIIRRSIEPGIYCTCLIQSRPCQNILILFHDINFEFQTSFKVLMKICQQAMVGTIFMDGRQYSTSKNIGSDSGTLPCFKEDWNKQECSILLYTILYNIVPTLSICVENRQNVSEAFYLPSIS